MIEVFADLDSGDGFKEIVDRYTTMICQELHNQRAEILVAVCKNRQQMFSELLTLLAKIGEQIVADAVDAGRAVVPADTKGEGSSPEQRRS